MEQIKVFENSEFGQVRTVSVNNEPWFVLTDVCTALELKNVSMVKERLDEDERSKFNLGRQGQVNIVNESGLYAVILRSDKPSAKKFRKWITSDVLPSIRKTGKYETVKLTDEHVKALEYIMKSTKEQLPFVSSILQDAGFNMGTSNAESYEDKFIKSLDVVGRITDDVYEEYTTKFGADSLSKTLFSRKVNLLHGTSTKTKKVGAVTKRTYELNIKEV
ncbi:BRO-N domain-containing protein [[Clostridium] polysaccharolyticum]|uniref:Prophage antirepressor n=1 Tax=[Clostridium] polysaccharolyticum TaxID=29364 RepID=A0A1H9YLQ9_9FIRM|nr:BRO family protein [[Clostridium] polysaccharolyticum]SES69427.1 Prophage antirepressor [[Clostridium] polysaccharolyticum]